MANDISTSFNDREMFISQPNWAKDVTSNTALERRILEQMGGVKKISSVITDAPITLKGDFTLYDRETVYNLLQFFNSRKGQTESFWFLHPARFFTLKEPYSSGNSYIVVDRNYGELWTQSLPSQYDWGIYIYMHNGDLICRKITGVTDNTDRSRLYLDESILRNITADNHFIIGRSLVGRFDQNEIQIDFSSQGVGIAPLKFKENYREYDAWVEQEGIRYWDLGKTSSGSNCGTAAAESLVAPFYGNIINSWDGYYIGGSYSQIYYYNYYMRFYNIDIPQGSVMYSAELRFICSGDGSPYIGFDFDLSIADYDNQPNFTTVGSFKALDRTTTVNWFVSNGVGWIVGEEYSSPNIAQCVHEVVNRAGWVSGNGMLLCGDQVSDRGYVQKKWKRPYPEAGPYHPRLKLSWV